MLSNVNAYLNIKLEHLFLSHFFFSGKSAKTGKMYALKQERPANLWEFYISLEIPTRVADSNIVSGLKPKLFQMER